MQKNTSISFKFGCKDTTKMSLLQENVYFFYGKVNKNAYFTLFEVNKNVNLVISICQRSPFVALRRFVCRWHVVNVIYVVCRLATLFAGYFAFMLVCYLLSRRGNAES